MTILDPVGDMLTRIRNAQRVFKKTAAIPHSKQKEQILSVLVEEGYIRGYRSEKDCCGHPILVAELKYSENMPVIREIHRVSKPGRRVYSKIKDLPLVFNGLGINILSTPKGIMSDVQARRQSLGGEVICSVF
jgi:small subunit ribosomal protein S8